MYLVQAEFAPAYHDFLIHQCQVAGFHPRVVPIGGHISTILGLVATRMGYAMVPEASIYSCPSQVVLFDHVDLTLSYPVEFVWRADAVVAMRLCAGSVDERSQRRLE